LRCCSLAGEVDDIYALEQRLRSAIAAPFEVAGLQLRLAASWGVAQFPRDADDADDALLAAGR
jgi:GGDEF domain-containing protein